MRMNLEVFTNDKYKLLKLLHDNQIKVKNEVYISLSQQEIADMAHYSKLKTNRLLNELINIELVTIYQNKKGKYALTDKAHKVLHLIQKTNI